MSATQVIEQKPPSLQELKRRVGLSPFTERIKIDRDGFSPCPFHNGDSDRSFHVMAKDDGAVIGTCFSECGKSWDAIDFVKAFDEVETGEAIRKLEESKASGRELPKRAPAVPMTAEEWVRYGQAVTDADVTELAASRPHSTTPSASVLNRLGFRIASMGGKRFIVAPYRLGRTFHTLKARNLTSKEFLQEHAVSQQGLFNIDDVNAGCDVYIVESELDAAVLAEHGYTAVSVINAKQKSIEGDVLEKLITAHRIFLVGDNDTAGVSCMDGIARLLPPEKAYRMPLTDFKDVGEWAAAIKHDEFLFGDFTKNWEQLRNNALASWVTGRVSQNGNSAVAVEHEPLRVDDAVAFIKEAIPERPVLLSPFLAEKSIGMIHAWRGVGKTHFGLGIGAAVASGGQFLKWKAPQAAPVMLIDGEMAQQELQKWLKEAITCEGIPPIREGFFRIVSADRQETGLPSLIDSRGQHFLDECIEAFEPKLIIFDNISTLFRGGIENDGDEWDWAQEWLIALRRKGIASLLLHHDGKGFHQRGTSKREDPLDWVIQLRHPSDYRFEQGLRCEVEFKKARGIYGADTRPFEAQLCNHGGISVWMMKENTEALADTIREMRDNQGMTFREIAKKLTLDGRDISKSTAERLYNKPVAAKDEMAAPF